MQAERPIKRGGAWWAQRPDGGWLRWDAESKAWLQTPDAPPPEREQTPPPAPPASVAPAVTPPASMPQPAVPAPAAAMPRPVATPSPAAYPAAPGPGPLPVSPAPPAVAPAPVGPAPIATAPTPTYAPAPTARPVADVLPPEPVKKGRFGRRGRHEARPMNETVIPRRGAVRARRLLLWLVLLAIVLGQSYYILAETDTLCYGVNAPAFAQSVVDTVMEMAFDYFQPDCS